jgi:hypothetical protein
MLLKGDATAEGTTHGNSWICSITVLLPQWILEAMLLGSFHWVSNEEILTLTLMVCGFSIKCNCHSSVAVQKPHIFLCKLVVVDF